MFHLDTLRLIKKTFKRFLTIFLMVFIGVCFMVGLLSTESIMHKSVDVYFDKYNFMDVQLYSSYGFDEEDVKAIKDTDNIKDVFASKFVDVFSRYEDKTFITRVQELESDVNKFELISGRMPKESHEALIVGNSDYDTLIDEGEIIKVYLEEGNVKDSLKNTEYKIVGTARSPQYMANQLETSTLDNLDIQNIIYVPNDNFLSDYYTSVYVTFNDSSSYTSFTKDYKDFIEEEIKELEDTASSQQDHRKNEVIKEVEEKIKQGEEELQSKTGAAQKEIDKGKKELEDGYIKILVGEAQIEINEKQLITAQKELETNKILLEQSQKQIEEGKKQVESQMGSSFEEAVESMEQLYTIYTGIEKIAGLNNGNITVSEKINENIKLILIYENENREYESEKIRLQLTGASQEEINDIESKIRYNKLRIESLNAENKLLNTVLTLYDDSSLDRILKLLDELAGGSVKDSYAKLQQLADGEKQVKDGLEQLKSGEAELKAGKERLESEKKVLEQGRKEYEKGLIELNKAQLVLDQELEKAKIELEKAKQQLEELPDSGWILLDRDSHYSTALYDNNAAQMKKIGIIFPMLFFAVAALVCMTTMKRLVDEQRSQIGVFSALGFTKNQIISKYVIYSFVASLPASLIGMFAGIPTFPLVIYVCWRLMYNLPDVVLYLPIHSGIIGVLSFTLLMMIVTYFVARGSLNEMPSQLMRPKAPKKAKKVFLENIPLIWNRLSFTSKVTARNLIRYKSRFFMTVLGVTGCTSLLVLGFGVKDSISQIIDIQIGEVFSYDYTVNLDESLYYDEVKQTLEEDSNVELLVPYISYSSKVYLDEEKTITVQVIDEDQYQDILSLRERKSKKELSLDDGVIISEKFSKVNNLKVGDKITIESSHGIKKDVEISGICEMYFQHYLFISTQEYEKVFDETVYYDLLAVNSKNNEEFIKNYRNLDHVKSITDFSIMKDRFQVMIEALDIIVIVILLASGSLAFVVLINLTEVNISERIREIATLKVLGFFDGEVNSYIFKEIFLLTLIGAISGLPIGKFLLGFVMNIIDMEMMMFGNDIKLMSYVYGFFITIGFAVIVLIFMRGTLKKVEMVESLKSVE